jgi:hypothetical protein
MTWLNDFSTFIQIHNGLWGQRQAGLRYCLLQQYFMRQFRLRSTTSVETSQSTGGAPRRAEHLGRSLSCPGHHALPERAATAARGRWRRRLQECGALGCLLSLRDNPLLPRPLPCSLLHCNRHRHGPTLLPRPHTPAGGDERHRSCRWTRTSLVAAEQNRDCADRQASARLRREHGAARIEPLPRKEGAAFDLPKGPQHGATRAPAALKPAKRRSADLLTREEAVGTA